MQSQDDTNRAGWEALANAVVERAADDYRWARRALARPEPGPDADAETIEKHSALKRLAHKRMREVEIFFRSEWYGQLTDADPEYIMQRLRECVR